MNSELTEEEVETIRFVLGYFGYKGGWQAGGFTQLIMQAYQKADPQNKARLRLAFPILAEAMDTVLDSLTGIKELAARVGIT